LTRRSRNRALQPTRQKTNTTPHNHYFKNTPNILVKIKAGKGRGKLVVK
jgi:hypothetical protein